MGKTLTLLLLFAASPAFAAGPLTWEDCLAIAIKNNPDLQAAQRTLEARRALKSESYNGVMPRLGLSSSYTDSKGHPRDGRWQAGATASMNIFSQSEFADIRASYANLDQASANLNLTASTVLFTLRQAFADTLFAQEQIDVSERIKDIRVRNSELVTLRYASGRESKGNKLRAQAELLQADMDLSQSRRDLKAAWQELNRQLGNDEFTVVTATGVLATVENIPEPAAFEPLVNDHPSIILEQANIDLARANLQQARSVLWPEVTANYSRSFRGEDYFPDQPNWTAAGVVSLPIFSGGPTSAYYNASAAKRNLEKSEQDLRSARNEVRSTLESSWSSYAGAQDQVKVQEAFLEAARQRNGEADVRYASGLMSYENWEQIVTDRVNFERSLVRAQRDAVVAEAQWERSLGKGLGE